MRPSYKVDISQRALRDIQAAFAFMEKSAPGSAAGVIRDILDGADSLADFPYRFPVIRTDRKGDIRRMVVRDYLLFYRIYESRGLVEIGQIRHGARRSLS